ncbi:MAG: ABC transporter ATP-binding protein [Verrucomicrobia bacterium]|jgi:ABC-2 type transport system ATP-binding protein|nr:ABC transporter ATP-binding protein [Verrucomicrobiota bacterium]
MSAAIDIQDLSVTYAAGRGSVPALQNLTMSIPTGQVFGFIGPNGAGKTTAMHVLLGFIEATSGTASIFGTDVRHSIARQRIGYLAEHPNTYRFLTGEELLRAAGQLFCIPRRPLEARIASLLEQLDLVHAAKRRVGTYSRGMLQRICIAEALINDPDLVILDEPTSGLDPIGRGLIRDIISDLRTRGKTVFFSSHELSEVELVCDGLAILNQGRLVAQGPTATLVPTGEPLERFFMRTIADGDAPSASDSSSGGLS